MKIIRVRQHAIDRARERFQATGTDEEIANDLEQILNQAKRTRTTRAAIEYEHGTKRIRTIEKKDYVEIITVFNENDPWQ